MSIDKNPNCPFIKRFSEDLKLNGKSPRTVQSYARALRKFIEYLGHTPDKATEDHLRNYLLFVTEKKQCIDGFSINFSSVLTSLVEMTTGNFCSTCTRANFSTCQSRGQVMRK